MSLSTTDQLRMRALRLLNDGRDHAEAAIVWAVETIDPQQQGYCLDLAPAEQPTLLSLRELSLGAAQ